jgi:hypothetical protein
MGRKVPFWCSVRLQGRLLLPFSDSLIHGVLRSSAQPRSNPYKHTGADLLLREYYPDFSIMPNGCTL